MIQIYLIIAVLLVVAELVYFRIADKYNIMDKSNFLEPNKKDVKSVLLCRKHRFTRILF